MSAEWRKEHHSSLDESDFADPAREREREAESRALVAAKVHFRGPSGYKIKIDTFTIPEEN